jgi:3D (Asp-Asp-Asp) domain-containing protein
MYLNARLLAATTFAVAFGCVASSAAADEAFTVTAYCQAGITKSGVPVRPGIAAGDPSYLPLGSIVHVDASSPSDSGVYRVLDTGSKVIGRHLDLFKSNCGVAKRFGRQLLRVRVLRFGWGRQSAQKARSDRAPN